MTRLFMIAASFACVHALSAQTAPPRTQREFSVPAAVGSFVVTLISVKPGV